MKKLRPLLLLAVLLLAALALTGCDAILGRLGLFGAPRFTFQSNGDGTCYIASISIRSDTDVVIPSKSPAGDRVTGIGEEAFVNRAALTSVTIPNAVTGIGKNAFWDCRSLASVTFADTGAWRADATEVTVTDPAANATYLKDTFCDCSWSKQ